MNLVNVIIKNGELNEFYAADIDSNGLLNASEFSDLLQSSSNSSEYFPDGLTQEQADILLSVFDQEDDEKNLSENDWELIQELDPDWKQIS